MQDRTTILVPIRYPLTDASSQTLAVAGRLAKERAPADLTILHVNLVQANGGIQTTELTQAISSVLDGVEASVITRRGFLVEEVILEEATQLGADVIVIGANRKPTWRQYLSQLIGNEPNVDSFLRENMSGEVEIVEVDISAEQPTIDAMVQGE